MIKHKLKVAGLASFLIVGCIIGAQAYQQFSNASVGVANGKLASLDSLASAYCIGQGFKGAEKYAFSGFVANGGRMNAVFSSVRCTMIGGVQPRSAGSINAKGTPGWKPNYGSDVSHGIAQAVREGAVTNALNKQFGGGSDGGNGGGGNGGGSNGGGFGGPGSLCCK
jgi:hypothetical protein